METITLNTTRVYQECPTSKYWRDVECEPQNAELKYWAANHPIFVLSGKIVKSHDAKEIGKITEVYVQTYNFWLEPEINEGIYTVTK